jgi:branched-chain amino acid transport system substrate-binding protein
MTDYRYMRARRLMFAAAIMAATIAGAARADTEGVTDREIVLGSVLDLSGPTAPLGRPIRDGLVVGFNMINEAGGIHGRKVRLIVEDSGYDPKTAIHATQRLINEHKVFAFISQLGGTIARVTAPTVIKENKAFLFPVAPVSDMYDPPRSLVFATLSANSSQGMAATTYLHDKMGKRRFCVLYQDDDSGEQTLLGVRNGLKARGEQIVAAASYKRGATDFSSHLSRLRAAGCDVVVLGTTVREAASALIERQKMAWDVPFVANQASAGTALVQLAGMAAEGVYGFAAYLPVGAIEDRPEIARVIERYRQSAGEKARPDESFFIAYAAAVLFAEA